jgi:hypothetical protein
VIDPTGIVIEQGIGVRHCLGWADCVAVLKFPDRIEMILNDVVSVIVRAADWYQGDEAMAMIQQVVPAPLFITIGGDAEYDPEPFRLQGLATWSSVVLTLGALCCLTIAFLGTALGISERRAEAVSTGMAFLLPVPFLVCATIRRLAVPRRWRARAAVDGRRHVVANDTLIRTSDAMLRVLIIALPLTGVAASLGWWLWTGYVPAPFITCGALAGVVAAAELRRRRRRQLADPKSRFWMETEN